jgi:ribonuclease P protein component
VKRRFRLSSSSDFKRVRRFGKSYAHPLIVLVSLPNELDSSRFGVAAGRSVGNAVQRNRAKRLLREGLRSLIPAIEPGWDLILIARHSLAQATLLQTVEAINSLLLRANLLKAPHDK